MKTCPTCKRTYEDDTLVFCLEDGARLSAAYDPHATLLGPAPRDTDPPMTAILPPELTPAHQAPPPLRPTIPAVAPIAYPQNAPHSQPPNKRGVKHWVVLSGMLALVIVGLMIVLGYLVWKANNKAMAEPSRVNSAAPPASNVPANANRDIESKLTDKAGLQWLDGVWEGEGYQSDTKTTWTVRLTAQAGRYAIEYPNIPCQGRWTLIESNTSEARFVEVITQGDRCATNSRVMIQKVNDSEISCKYTYARNRLVIATVVLTKRHN